jgi:hypothetical protein
VGGNLNLDGDPSDEFLTDTDDSNSGPGVGSEGFYTLVLTEPVSGDFDFYQFSANEFDTVDIEVDTSAYGGILDTIVAVFDSTGTLVSLNDDAPDAAPGDFDSFLSVTIPSTGSYYAVVGGFSWFPTDADSFPSDAFDSSTGPGFGSEGDYDITLARNISDIDFFSFELEAGDIFAANVTGSAQATLFFDENATNLNVSFSDSSGIFPASSDLPGGGNASTAYIVNEAGTYFAGVTIGEGPYVLELRAFRPPQEATKITQKLFLDFDGATLDTRIFGPSGIANAVLSPLSAFLADWGLAPADEDALITGIVAEVRQALETDIKSNGLSSAFDIEILNSRDHADPFGDADVSRVIVGGTIAESGIDTIGIAQSVDVGNYDLSETALVLLDSLSSPTLPDPNSLNQFAVDPGSTKVALVAAGVGNIISHEAGHFFANFHTNNLNAISNLMDTGGNLPGLVGVGIDGIWGNGDDENVVFGLDEYDLFEGFLGVEDTRNSIAFGLTAGPDLSLGSDITAFADVTGDAVPDVAGFAGDITIRPSIAIYSGANGTVNSTIDYINDKWQGLALSTVRDADQNGTADDPAVAMLVTNKTTSKIRVESRRLDTGAFLGSIQFLNENWRPIDVVVVDDLNGDGVTDDTAIAVLSERYSDGRIQLQLRNFVTGALISNTVYLNARWTPFAAAVANRTGQPPVIGVIAHNTENNKRTMQSRVAGSGDFDQNIKFLGSTWDYLDVSVNHDANSDGVMDDPAWLVLAVRPTDNVIRVQSKFVSDGSFDDNIVILNSNWEAFRMDVAQDMTTPGNMSEEMVISAIRRADAVRRIHVKDYSSAATTINIAP